MMTKIAHNYSEGDVVKIEHLVNVYLEPQNFSSPMIFYLPELFLEKGDIIVLLYEDQKDNVRVLSRLGIVCVWKAALTNFCSL